MNYQKIYEDLISKAKSENRKKLKRNDPNFIYYEKHHIIPRCMNGDNSKDNLVLLTAREHFVAHKLLHFINPDNKSLFNAYFLISVIKGRSDKGYCRISSKEYERLKILNSICVSKSHLGKITSKETRLKQRKAALGRIMPEHHKERLRALNTNSKLSDETRLKMSISAKKVKKTKEHNKNVSLAIRNLPNLKCSYCGLECKIRSFMNRWHFDNCKQNPNRNPKIYKCDVCSFCSENSTIIKRWHNDNCKLKMSQF